jgi:hypothetical protein
MRAIDDIKPAERSAGFVVRAPAFANSVQMT